MQAARAKPVTGVDEALAFVERHGVVLASARGPVPSLAEAIAGGPIRGSWWSHPNGKRIFAMLGAVSDSPDILVCRAVGGKVTLVHRRLWPALVRVADRFAPQRVSRIREEHTPSGRHATREVTFPEWVPRDVVKRAQALGEGEALAVLGDWARAPR